MSDQESILNQILVINTDAAPPSELIEKLKHFGQVHIETDPDSISDLLQNNQYDLIVSTSAELLTTGRPADHQFLNVVLDTIGQGVCIVELDGQLIWSNNKFKELPEEVYQRIRDHCLEHFRSQEDSSIRPRSLSLKTENENYFEAKITPMTANEAQTTKLVVAVTDVSRARRLQKKMDAIDNAGRELVRLDTDMIAKMDARERLELLEQNVLRYTRELLQFDNFVIRILDRNTNKLELVLCAGLPPDSQQIDIYATTEDSGISGYVAATGRSYICHDAKKDSRYLPGLQNAKSSLTVPLRLHDHIIGTLNIESEHLGAFSEDDRQFAEIFGRYIAIALHILDLLVVERHATTGQLADNVTSEIASPLSDILADASTLMEDYIGHDDLRHRLQNITDNVVKIKSSIKQVTQPGKGILGARPQKPMADPIVKDKKILVIDDEEIIRLTVADVITKSGGEVESARDGNEALAMINRRSYDLVITDIRMPGRNGYEIFAAVKNTYPDCPVMFITGFGYDPNHSIIRARKEGLAAVLYKPFKVDELLNEVRAAVSASKNN
ncbi:MAG: response regulator [Planctomycetota bacterium]|nr:MAG: response regulator [Planctomycetota bacterium]